MEYHVEVVENHEQRAAVVRGRVAHDGIPEFLGRAFGEALAAAGGEGGVAGPPFARYDVVPEGFDIEAGFPVSGGVAAGGGVEETTLPGGAAATTMHVGPYEELAGAYRALEAWLGDNGRVPAGRPWESYLDDPDVAAPRTVVTWPCRPAS